MLPFQGYNITRPNRLNSVKDKKYHSDFAKWALSSINHPLHRAFMYKTMLNWSFYKGGDYQWILEEDLEAFFLDESGDVKNRIKITQNIIKPIVQQYKGNAVRLSFRAKAKATSDFAINRREKELKRLKFFNKLQNIIPEYKNFIKERFNIGETEDETEEIFENMWIDEYEEDINNLLEYVAKDIDMEEIKVNLAQNLALSGIGIYKGYEYNMAYQGEYVDPLFFIWDKSAKKPDLTDAEYMGEWSYMSATTIFERWQDLTKEEREQIEKYSSTLQGNKLSDYIFQYKNNSGNKIPVYEIYWRDTERQEYGWVRDEYGYPYFTRINDEYGKYTDKDLIEPPTENHKKLLNGKKKRKIYVDYLRYCILIPGDQIGSREDIVLEYGLVPYQQKNTYSPSSVSFPYKVYTWGYDRGEVLSPIDDVINPQRFMNRILSVIESQVNNTTGSGVVIAKDAIDPRDGEEGVIRNVNKSKPIFVDTRRTGSVQNSVGQYQSTFGAGALNMYNVIQNIQNAVQQTTGVNEAMMGTIGGSDKLVGVIQSQIQRGSLIQEPFYYALSKIIMQAFQHIADVGKKIYAESPRRLSIIAGDKGMQNIIITKDVELEDFKIFIERVESEETAIEKANALLFTLLQSGLIDDKLFAELFNKADADLISKKMLEYVKEKNMVARQQAQIQQQQQAQMQELALKQQQAEMEQKDKELAVKDKMNREKVEGDILKAALKEDAKNKREIGKI